MKMWCRTSPEPPNQECLHTPDDLIWGMCVHCGQTIPDHLVHQTINKTIAEKHPRLSLVLDLDHTLLNTTPLSTLTKPETDFLTPLVDSLDLLEQPNPSGALFTLDQTQMTKLRPFVRNFLEEASRIFDLYVFTMGTWSYASDMVYLLDPKSMYFERVRVFTRDDATINNEKSLNVVTVAKSACLILDDLEVVWPDDRDNLIQIEKYLYFASSCGSDRKSLSELKVDESEGSGSLVRVLGVLRRVHETYFNGGGWDVREILRDIREDILRGCRVLFSSSCNLRGVEKKAVALGAVREACLGPTVTHVVAEDLGSEEAVWAVKEGKFLVSPRWIEAAYYLWERQNETTFVVT